MAGKRGQGPRPWIKMIERIKHDYRSRREQISGGQGRLARESKSRNWGLSPQRYEKNLTKRKKLRMKTGDCCPSEGHGSSA